MKKLIIISLLVLFVSAQTYSTTNCVCAQLLSSADCTKLGGLNCSWDSTNNKCATSSTVTPSTPTVAQYCDPFSSTDCPNTTGCAWVSTKCTFFTGCTAFAKTTDADCKAISSRCITDGTHCVEKNICSTYLKQLPCVKNAAGAYCYWDTTNNVCVDANTCDKLPSSLALDSDCRTQIPTCTAKTGGGCQDSGINCSDQTTQISCVWNKVQSQACYWNSTACVDKICANAPNTLTTDDACIQFKSDGTCTTKLGGGCVIRSTCSAATIQAACVKSSSGSACYWNGTACVDKLCSNAPATMTTNTACQGFISTCITTGAGCTNNGSCSAATVQVACDKNSSGSACIWNTTCKDKTCTNAPSTNTTHDLCTSYLSSCTVNSGANGCTTRTCDNAPTSIVTNENCEAYLPGSHCVAKSGGGCVTNGACTTLGQVACVKNISGNDCLWDTTCKDKTCVNAPATANTHALCQAYLKTCTVNSSGTCVTETCENIQTSDVCTTDFNGNPCIYKAKCYVLQCAQATTQTTHAACQTFSIDCTLNNSGTGCVSIPLSCSAITLQAACYLRQSPSGTANCGWNGLKCIDQDCTTVDKAVTTTLACNSALTGCVSANPVGSAAVAGCMALPTTCAARATLDNCPVAGGGLTCLWNTAGSGSCVQKSCATASVTTTPGSISTFANSDCDGYLTGCFQNNTADGCMAPVTACSALSTSTNCNYTGAKTGGTFLCYWNSTACVDRTCANIAQTSHSNCHSALNTCTVNSGQTNCQSFAACNTYMIKDQCHFNASGKSCFWTGTACRDEVCTDADTTNKTSAACAALTFSGTVLCNVITRVSNQGCMAKQASCSGYTEQTTCIKDGSGNTCYWQGSTCWLSSAFTCANASLSTYGLTDCEGVDNSCKNNGATACMDKVCSDYTKADGTSAGSTDVASDSDCSTLDPTCTIDVSSGAVKCQTKQAVCGSYKSLGACTFATEGSCHWDGTVCAKATTCANIFLTTYNAANCEGVKSSCINNSTTACQDKVCTDYTTQNGLTGGTAVSTDAHCSALLSTCTIDNTSGSVKCQTKSATCNYASADTCKYTKATTDGACYWDTAAGTPACAKFTSCATIALATFNAANCEGAIASCTNNTTTACQDKVCSDYSTQNGLSGGAAVSTEAHCSALLNTCTIDKTSGAVKCQTKQANCSGYTASGLGACTFATTDGTCYWTGSACAKLTATACTGITLSTYNAVNCENVISTCTNNSTTACQTKVCTDYSTQNGLTGGTAVSTDAHCSTLLNTCTIDNTSGAVKCQTKKATCSLYLTTGPCTVATEGTCFWTGTLCVFPSATTCASKTGSGLTDTTCASYFSGCTQNAGGTACQARAATCASQLSTACYKAVEGDCYAIGTLCLKKTCDNAPTTITTDANCSAYLSSCTIARGGGCIARQACNLYTSALQCTSNASGSACYWSVATYTCLDLTCANLDQTSSYNSHNLCNAALNTCTVRATNGAAVNGCQSYSVCSSYTILEQCHANSSSGVCEWNTNLTPAACVDRACTTAASSFATHSACKDHNGTNTCTVGAVAGANGAANTLSGCIALGPCSSYIDAEQCHINAAGNACGWDGSVCADFSCTTSPSSNTTDTQCESYKSGCTVDQDGAGCMALLTTCEAYQIQANCVVDSSNNNCYWDATTTKCVTRTCDNAPDSALSASDCNTYLAGCTLDSVKCKTKICEDFLFATDALCKASLSKCTTDGMKCVLRGSCIQALDQTGCVTDSTGNQCEWVPAANAAAQPYCTLKTCLTAPLTNTTESSCASYFNNCTTKNGGGCVIKSTCAAANVQASCTTAQDGTKCQWDTITTPNACRNKDCQDYQGSTHSVCQAISTTCTAGVGGFCARIKSCANTTVQAACITGSDGPCLWVAGVTNADGSKGACYPYTSCKSLAWTADNKCKLISPNCTTNGSMCLAVTLCTETNVSGGCVTGYDGNCIQTVSALGSTDAPICKAFTSCSDAFYATNSGCQTANSKCTTNGTTGCIPFASCSSYTQAGCYVNAAGPQVTNGKVTSTGVCTWDNTAAACRDQTCSDLTGTNHSACVAQLSTCTSDGTNCLASAACGTYTQAQCGVAMGTDGICFWQVTTTTITTAVCRVMNCADVVSGTTTSACLVGLSGCVSNGTSCIAKANCSAYTTKTSCNSGGLDGICYFTASTATGATAGAGTCALMTSCSTANSDQNACTAAKSRCSWTAASGSGTTAVTSKCVTHTCASYQSTNNVCANFLNWAQTLQQVCQIKTGVCTETDPTTLSQTDCYAVSSYTYTWSSSTSKCGVCTTPATTNNSTNPNGTNDTNTTTTSGFVLSFATVVFGYLVF